eukprot:4039772-Prorocentrum_lima.AAC.1
MAVARATGGELTMAQCTALELDSSPDVRWVCMPTDWPEWEEAEDADGGGPSTCGRTPEPTLPRLSRSHHISPEWESPRE